MKVKLVKENSVIEVNDSYGLRLITQGKAVLAPKPAKKPDRKEAAGAAPQSAGLSRRQSQSDLETRGVSNLKPGDA